MTLDEALAIVRAAGYRVMRPKTNGHKAALGLNAIGRPYGAGFDPNYKMKYNSRAIVAARLVRPMPANTPWKRDA